MNILIVSATIQESTELIKLLDFKQKASNFFEKKIFNKNIDLLISGIGLIFTTYSLSKAIFAKKYDLVINIGIAGSFKRSLKLGELVYVTSEQFADLGIRDKDNFIDIFDAGFISAHQFPFSDKKLKPKVLNIQKLEQLKKVKSISVNTVSGNQKEIDALMQQYDADVESMEGAAVFYVCMNENIPVLQIRSISNYVEERDKSKWNIPLAINMLSNFCFGLIQNL